MLDDFICNNFHSPDIELILNEFHDFKTELQTLYTKKGNAAIFRSKCRWVEKDERPTKNFFNLERRNYNKKILSELRMEDETIIKNETQVLDVIENYFNDLYSSASSTTREEYDTFIQELRLPELCEERDELEGPSTYDECKQVLETFQNDKSPGEDGFTVELYNLLFELLGHNLVESFNEAYETNELSSPKEEASLLLYQKRTAP